MKFGFLSVQIILIIFLRLMKIIILIYNKSSAELFKFNWIFLVFP